MTQQFRRTATVTFMIAGTDQTITISNVPYIWIGGSGVSMDQEGANAARDWFRMNMQSKTAHLITQTIETSPAEEK